MRSHHDSGSTGRATIIVIGLLAISGLTLVVVRDPIVATAAQVVLATFAVAAGVMGTRLLHDRIGSSVRASVSSGVGAATWLTFVPFAIAFGALADDLGIQAGGWLLMGLTVASLGLLLRVARTDASVRPPLGASVRS